MRICLVVPGGVSRDGEYKVVPAILWLIERLARHHDVDVLTLRQEPHAASWELLGATVHCAGIGAGRPGALRVLLRLHRHRPFDVYHSIWARGSGDVALAAALVTRRPLLVHLGGGELVWMPEVAFGGAARPWTKALTRFVLRRAAHVTAASEAMLELGRAAGVDPIHVPLGVDTNRWIPSPPRARTSDRPARLVHVGNLNLVKDQATLLRALRYLVKEERMVHLDIVGADALQGSIQQLVREWRLSRFVTFHGFLPQRRLVPVVRGADLMVVSSRHEAGPVVMLEAAAVGVPTVGTNVGHVRDFAPEAATAVPIADSRALAAAIGRSLDDDHLRLATAHRAQSIAVQHNADWTAARFEQLYLEITQRARGTRARSSG